MHWTTAVVRGTQGAHETIRGVAQIWGVHYACFRLGSRTTTSAPLLRDGDLIPFSMTIALLAL